MAMTYEELHRKTVAELREIAKGLQHEAVQGHTQMNKDHLLPAICAALGIDAHVHHHADGSFDKATVKARMRQLHLDRAKAIGAKDTTKLRLLRRELHTLNHRLRAHTI